MANNQRYLEAVRGLQRIFNPNVEILQPSRNVGPEGREENANDPQQRRIVAYDSNEMQMVLTQRNFRRHTQARIYQHLYCLRVEMTRQNHVPLLVSLLPALSDAVIRVLTRLRNEYLARGRNYMLFVTLVRNEIEHGKCWVY